MIVNRHLPDKAMDAIDHALGRPVDPLQPSYRNNYVVCVGSDLGGFEDSPNWFAAFRFETVIHYQVTPAGRRALAQYLKKIGDKHRVFVVSFSGHENEVVATSHGRAKYLHWMNISDCLPDLRWPDFMRRAKVRVASPNGAAR